MDAKEFWKEFGRMCTSNLCSECPAQDLYCSMTTAFNNNDTSIVDAVEKWSKEHPRKTRQSVFMKQWPDVWLDGNRVISVSPCTLSKEYRDMDCDLRDCAECRKEFWMKEVE